MVSVLFYVYMLEGSLIYLDICPVRLLGWYVCYAI